MTQDTINPTDMLDTNVEGYENYWGVEDTFKFMLPDGKQYFEVKPMDEGAKTRFQKLTNKGIRMNQRSQEATIDVDPSDERHTLIEQSVVDWKIMQRDRDGNWSELPCPVDERQRKRSLSDNILEKFNPKAIQDLEFFIRTKNPWMQADMDLDQMNEELDRITLLIKQKKEQDAGELASATK